MQESKTIRMNDETSEALKAVKEDMNANSYQEVLLYLFGLYDMEKSKNGIKNRQNEIETFEKHTKVLFRMFLSSLEENQVINEMVKADFEDKLNSKEALILELQECICIEKQKQDEVKCIMEKREEEIKGITEKYASAEAEITYMKELLVEKERLNQIMTTTCEEQQRKLAEVQQAFEEVEVIKQKVVELGKENEQLAYKNSELENDLVTVKKEAESTLSHALERAQLDMEKAVLACEKEYRALLEQIRNEKQQVIEKYQLKVERLQEGLQIVPDEQ